MSIKIRDLLPEGDSMLDPRLLKVLDFLETTVLASDGSPKELEEEYLKEQKKMEELEREYLEFKIMESAMQTALKQHPSEEVGEFQKEVLPFLDLLVESKGTSAQFAEVVACERKALEEVVERKTENPIAKMKEKVQYETIPIIQDLLHKKKCRVESLVKTTIPPKLLDPNLKLPEALKNIMENSQRNYHEIIKFDSQIAEKQRELDSIISQNIEKIRQIGEKYIYGSYKLSIESHINSLAHHLHTLRSKRKILKSDIYKASMESLHKVYVELEMKMHYIAKEKDALYKEISKMEKSSSAERNKLHEEYEELQQQIDHEILSLSQLKKNFV